MIGSGLGVRQTAGRKEDKLMEGWQEHRLNQKEKLNMCVHWSLMRFRVGLGTRMKGVH